MDGPQLSDALAGNVQLRAQLVELKGDFQYNLQLLAERDAELERLDANSAQLEAETAAKAASVLQLRSALAQAQSGEWYASVRSKLCVWVQTRVVVCAGSRRMLACAGTGSGAAQPTARLLFL